MTLPHDQRLKFFVFVIESPSPVDIYHGRSEAYLLKQAIGLNNIPCESVVTINSEAFIAALTIGFTEAMNLYKGKVPVIHISAHGFNEGIQLSNGEVIKWARLRELLLPINKAFQGGLLLCMSTCEGYSASRMAMVLENTEHPFFAIVGNGGNPTWPETAVAFATFYHLVANGHFIINSVEAMRTASGNRDFFVTTAEEAKKGYVDYIKHMNTERAQEELQQQAGKKPVSELAKQLSTIK